jgi:hypothetical protein
VPSTSKLRGQASGTILDQQQRSHHVLRPQYSRLLWSCNIPSSSDDCFGLESSELLGMSFSNLCTDVEGVTR